VHVAVKVGWCSQPHDVQPASDPPSEALDRSPFGRPFNLVFGGRPSLLSPPPSAASSRKTYLVRRGAFMTRFPRDLYSFLPIVVFFLYFFSDVYNLPPRQPMGCRSGWSFEGAAFRGGVLLFFLYPPLR